MHLLHYAGEQYIGLYEDIPILGHGFRETRRHSHNLWYISTSISSFRMTMTDENCTVQPHHNMHHYNTVFSI